MTRKNTTVPLFSASKNRYVRWLKIAGVYLGVAIALTLSMCGGCLSDWQIFVRNTAHNLLLTVVLWVGNGMLTDWLDQKLSWVDQPILRTVVGIMGMIVYSVLALIASGFFFYVVVYDFPVHVFWERVVSEVIVVGLMVTAFIALVLHSIAFFKHWREAALTAEKLKREKLASQYSSLKNQLNPHFLFNSLNTLSALVYKDPDASAQFIKQLSHIYRYVLENAEKEVVTLEKEISFIRDYLDLLSIRFGENLQYSLDIPKHEEHYIAPLTLQLLVENAIKHNVISRDEPFTLNIYREDDMIVVQNPIQLRAQVADSTGTGLKNIRFRYEHLTDEPVRIDQNNQQFTVKIPLLSLTPYSSAQLISK